MFSVESEKTNICPYPEESVMATEADEGLVSVREQKRIQKSIQADDDVIGEADDVHSIALNVPVFETVEKAEVADISAGTLVYIREEGLPFFETG